MTDQTQDPTPEEDPADPAADPESGGPVAFAEASPDTAAQTVTPPSTQGGADATPTVDPVATSPVTTPPATAPTDSTATSAPESEPVAQPRGPMAQAPAEPRLVAGLRRLVVPTRVGTAGSGTRPTAVAYPPGYAPTGGQPNSRVAAGVLGILLGGLGVHRFYLGYTNIGIIQILVTVFTCGLGSIWGFVEGILILVKNDNFLTDANGVPLAD